MVVVLSVKPSSLLKALLVLLAALSLAPGQKYPFTYYTPESEINPLPGAAVNCLLQDREGYIWYTVYSIGVVRYDGKTQEIYTPADGLRGRTVMNMQLGPKGRLWVLSDLGLSASEKPLHEYGINERIAFTTTVGHTALAEASVSQVGLDALLSDARGNVWLGTTGMGIVRYRYDNAGFLSADTFASAVGEEGGNATVYALGGGNRQAVWAGVEGGLLKYDEQENRFVPAVTRGYKPASNTHRIEEGPDGVLWGGCENGQIWKYEHNGEGILPVNHQLSGTINDILFARNGDMWVASDHSGLLVFPSSPHKKPWVLTEKNGLLNNILYDLLEDREGNMWITHVAGISKLRYNYRAFNHVTRIPETGEAGGFRGFAVSSICPPSGSDRYFPLWVSSKTGLVYFSSFEDITVIDSEKGLRNNDSYDIIRDEQGRIWAGNFTGLQCISTPEKAPVPFLGANRRMIDVGGARKTLSYFDVGIIGVCNRFRLPLSPGSPETEETLWFNSYLGMVAYISGEWFVFAGEAGLPPSIMYTATVDRYNRLWVGTGDRGAYQSPPLNIRDLLALPRDKKNRVTRPFFKARWNRDNGAPVNEIGELIALGDTLYLGADNGLWIVALDSLKINRKLVKGLGSPDANIASMAISTDRQTIWVGTNNGLFALDVKRGKIVRQLSREEGLLSDETNWLQGVRTADNGRVYMANPNGFTIYDPSLDTVRREPPPIKIKRLDFRDDPWGRNELLVEYTALSYSNEKKNRFRTRLIGYDTHWSPETGENKIRYTGLPAYFWSKRYRFQVMAANSDGVWTEVPASVTFDVRPPLFFRWWAFVLYLLLIVSTGFGLRWFTIHWREFFIPRRRYISHYKLLDFLGKGGMGEVYRARDIHNDAIVAIKLLAPELLENPDNRRRLMSEGHLISTLSSPYIVKAHEIGESADSPYIVMEYLSGGTLRDYVRQNHPLPVAEIKRIARQICLGLQAIHDKGIYHRDLKTGNIMFDERKNLRIMDFGLSRSPLVSTMTTLGTVIGTLGYVAPEQITNQNVDHRTDIFSLGVILYELALNRAPFSGDNEIVLIHSIFNSTPPLPSSLREDTGPAFDAIVMKCLEKNPEKRFESTAAVLTALGDWEAEKGS